MQDNAYAYGPNPITWIDPMGLAHKMTVTSAPKGFKAKHASDTTKAGPMYESGMDPCPKDLKSRARCHTEQKFAHDLLARGLSEHQQIVVALDKLQKAAREESRPEVVRFTESLKRHAKNEEEVLYPAAILIGEYLKVKL